MVNERTGDRVEPRRGGLQGLSREGGLTVRTGERWVMLVCPCGVCYHLYDILSRRLEQAPVLPEPQWSTDCWGLLFLEYVEGVAGCGLTKLGCTCGILSMLSRCPHPVTAHWHILVETSRPRFYEGLRSRFPAAIEAYLVLTSCRFFGRPRRRCLGPLSSSASCSARPYTSSA